VRGRLFTPADEDPAVRVAVVNEAFAAQYVPDGDAVGRIVRLDPAGPVAPGEPLTIAGVVPNVRQTAIRQESVGGSAADAVVYIPYAAAPPPFATVIVRAGSGAGTVAVGLRAALARVDPDVPFTNVVPLDEAIRQELGILALFGSMFGLFAATALGLASVGLYAVTAHAAARRTQELGVRLALGARARHVWWVVTRRAAIQVGVGLVLGTAGALGVGQLLRGGLTGVSSRDPVTLVGVPLLMVAVALAACALPAVRATRLDAAAALRVE
jgi:putative ABC transport system permease protein